VFAIGFGVFAYAIDKGCGEANLLTTGKAFFILFLIVFFVGAAAIILTLIFVDNKQNWLHWRNLTSLILVAGVVVFSFFVLVSTLIKGWVLWTGAAKVAGCLSLYWAFLGFDILASVALLLFLIQGGLFAADIVKTYNDENPKPIGSAEVVNPTVVPNTTTVVADATKKSG